MPMYYYSDGTPTPVGPVDHIELSRLHAAGTIQSHTPVIAEGASQWSTYDALIPSASGNTGAASFAQPSSPPPPAASAAPNVGTAGVRGRILQYNPNDGKGIVMVNGSQYAFEIGHWRGAEVPQVNRTVDVAMANGSVSAVSPVSESVLMAEKTEELKSKLGGVLGGAGITNAQSFIDAVGKPMLIAYAVFILSALILPVAKIEFLGFGQSATLWKATGLADLMGSNYRILLWLSFLSFLVPVFWRNPKAWLATLIPILSLAWMGWSAYSQMHSAMDTSSQMMGGLFGDAMPQRKRESPFSLGFGAYVCLASALYIGYLGVRKYMVRS